MLEFHDILAYFVSIMLWLYERFILKISNFLTSIIVDNLEHVTFWPQEYLWINSHVLNLWVPYLYFSKKKTLNFSRILHFRKVYFTEHFYIFSLKIFAQKLDVISELENNCFDGQLALLFQNYEVLFTLNRTNQKRVIHIL